MTPLFGLSLVAERGPEDGATIHPFGPGRSIAPRSIRDEAATFGNRIVLCNGDPAEASNWRAAGFSDLEENPLTLSGIVRATNIDLAEMSRPARVLIGDLIAYTAQLAKGIPGRTVALAIEGDVVVIAPPYVPKGGATSLTPNGKSLHATLGRVSDGTPTGLLSVRVVTASARRGEGDLNLTLRHPKTALSADLDANHLGWDDVMRSAMILDAIDKKAGTLRVRQATWLQVAVTAMEESLQGA